MQLFVRNLEGSTSVVCAEASDSMADIKLALESRGMIPKEGQILIHGRTILDDESTVAEVGLSHGSNLQLTARLRGGKPVKVKILTNHLPCGQEVTIDIEPSANKDEIKSKLATVTGVPFEYQKVMLSGINQIVMSDKRTNLGYSFCGSTNGVQMAVNSK